jgi:hypothetical protein
LKEIISIVFVAYRRAEIVTCEVLGYHTPTVYCLSLLKTGSQIAFKRWRPEADQPKEVTVSNHLEQDSWQMTEGWTRRVKIRVQAAWWIAHFLFKLVLLNSLIITLVILK